jgi:cytochrome c peroxidase
VTGKDADRFNFKVPTLRNVELTYPYFHDGEADTLERSGRYHGPLQLGKKFTQGRERQDRRLPEDPDRRPAQLQDADPAAVDQRHAASEALRVSPVSGADAPTETPPWKT